MLPAHRCGELPADEQAVFIVDGNDVARLGCGRVLPVRTGPEVPACFPGRDRRAWITDHVPLASTSSCDANLPRRLGRAPARQAWWQRAGLGRPGGASVEREVVGAGIGASQLLAALHEQVVEQAGRADPEVVRGQPLRTGGLPDE